jgi:hypothetical protein
MSDHINCSYLPFVNGKTFLLNFEAPLLDDKFRIPTKDDYFEANKHVHDVEMIEFAR